MRTWHGLILLTLCLLLADKRGGNVQALRLDRILGIVDRISQMSGSGATTVEATKVDPTSEAAKLSEEESESSESLEAEEVVEAEDIDRTHHQHSHKHKAPIIATKTVFLQVTKQVTRHPVCMSVKGVKPPCLPAEISGHVHHEGVYGQHYWGREDLWGDGMQEEGLYIEPTATIRISEATASAESSEALEEDGGESEDDTFEFVEPSSREGRYLEMLNRETPAPLSTTAATSVINEQPESEDRHLGSLMSHVHKHQKKQHKYVTKTLVVTKVQPITDYRVTATLEVKNCIPHDVKIPFCPIPNAPHIPLSLLHPVVHGPVEETIEHLEEEHHPVEPIIHKPIIKPPHKPVKPIISLPINPPHKPIIKPPHKPMKPIISLPINPPHKPIIKPPHKPVKPIISLPIKPTLPILNKPTEQEHHEPEHPPQHLPIHHKPEKPSNPILPIISSALQHTPIKPVSLEGEVQHSLNTEESEHSEEVFDYVDENLKESKVPLEQ